MTGRLHKLKDAISTEKVQAMYLLDINQRYFNNSNA